jgi:hypothetical protein
MTRAIYSSLLIRGSARQISIHAVFTRTRVLGADDQNTSNSLTLHDSYNKCCLCHASGMACSAQAAGVGLGTWGEDTSWETHLFYGNCFRGFMLDSSGS